MSDPRVSIICPFFNGARFIREAVDSVLAQDFEDFELLLIDDGSGDGSSEIARDYAGRFPNRIRYIQHPRHVNRGTSPTRNLGFDHARGDFVAFIDSDDVWRPSKLSEQVALMVADPRIGMLCGTVNYWGSWAGGEDRLVPTGRLQESLLMPPDALLHLYPLGDADAPCPSDVMVRRSLVQAGCRFEENMSGPVQMYEDQTFFVKVYLNAPMYFSSQVWLNYRQHSDSCVSTVFRHGLYEDMRSDFLDWLETYVETHEAPRRESVLRAIGRARYELEHPAIGRLWRRGRRLLSGLRRSSGIRRPFDGQPDIESREQP